MYYKIVEERGENNFFTLFHGIAGSKKLELNKWIKAEIKNNVMDGYGTKYTSGIHIIDGCNNAKEYLKRFKLTNRVIIPCFAKGLRRKQHSKSYVYLADKIKLFKLVI